MSGVVCPSCGVAVVPGYVRCPKCHKPLPRRPAPVVGGTTVQPARRFPVLPIAGAVIVAVATIAFFGLRDDDKPAAPPPATPAPVVEAPGRELTPVEVATPPLAAAPVARTPQQVVNDLERALKKQRLWSTVRVVGDRAEVRSGSCEDPALAATLDSAAPALKAAGLTALRCLEQSGRVVTTREL
jgi:hypothetical protein